MEEGWMKIDTFHNQYKSILLLLYFGIGNLPYELVYMILKDYVYKPPSIRISKRCIGTCQVEYYTHHCDTKEVKDVCFHVVQTQSVNLSYNMDAVRIRKWLENNDISVPYHFYDDDDDE